MAVRPQFQRNQETLSPSATAQVCANCQTMAKCRRRDFSEQAWAVLLSWEEVQKAAVDQSICNDCYDELREVLIDRADEIEAALHAPRHRDEDSGAETTRKAAGASKKPKRASKIASQIDSKSL